MKSLSKLYLQRAENELITAQILFQISNDKILQKEVFRLEEEFTFYSAVISHAYYCIFNSAKAILCEEGIKTKSPEVHKKTLEAFKHYFVETGRLDVELLKMYKKNLIRAEELLSIFVLEKSKRGKFTYQKLPQANLKPAQDSLRNSWSFFKNIYNILE